MNCARPGWGRALVRASCWPRENVTVGVARLDDVQLAMPTGREAEAMAFYEGLLRVTHAPSLITSRLAAAAGSRMAFSRSTSGPTPFLGSDQGAPMMDRTPLPHPHVVARASEVK